MLEEAHSLPDDIAALTAMVLASRAELRNRNLLIEKLKHQLAGVRRQRFGARSEAPSTSLSSRSRTKRSPGRPRRCPKHRAPRRSNRRDSGLGVRVRLCVPIWQLRLSRNEG